jgi:hypothetical protein
MRREQIRKPKRDPELALEEHLQALGLPSLKAYQDWCSRNGFATALRKHRKQLAQERQFAKQATQPVCRTDRQRENRRPFEYITAFCAGAITESYIETPQLRHLHQLLSQPPAVEPFSHDRFLRLATHVHRVRGNFFVGVPAFNRLGTVPSNTFLSGLTLLAAYSDVWIRAPEQWKPPSYNPRRQFGSLVRHLFDRHGELPDFFDSVWFLDRNVEAERRRRWCIHVARGRNIRQCDLPISYTKTMTQHFLKAPASLTIDQALRWGQVRGLGGDERLAATILQTRLETSFENDSFRATVIQWLAENPMLDQAHVGPIIDYLHEQKFVPDSPRHTNVEIKRPFAVSLGRGLMGNGQPQNLDHSRIAHQSFPSCRREAAQTLCGQLRIVVYPRHEREESNPVRQFWRLAALPGAHFQYKVKLLLRRRTGFHIR